MTEVIKVENLKRAKVNILEAYMETEQLFDALVDMSESWNGWRVPLLDKENVRKAIEALTAPKNEQDPDSDMWVEEIMRDDVTVFVEHSMGDVIEYTPVVEIEGTPYYRFGDGWCWDVIDPTTQEVI